MGGVAVGAAVPVLVRTVDVFLPGLVVAAVVGPYRKDMLPAVMVGVSVMVMPAMAMMPVMVVVRRLGMIPPRLVVVALCLG